MIALLSYALTSVLDSVAICTDVLAKTQIIYVNIFIKFIHLEFKASKHLDFQHQILNMITTLIPLIMTISSYTIHNVKMEYRRNDHQFLSKRALIAYEKLAHHLNDDKVKALGMDRLCRVLEQLNIYCDALKSNDRMLQGEFEKNKCATKFIVSAASRPILPHIKKEKSKEYE
ncbi:unnamed protein product [Meganyctiphanes norvegica]|uniref:Uncharacterized protein n=1 Tax=Meganyctiphanes norvegica TaxID=48144 RepID=A0AAV2Q4V2_MEGNR